MTPSGTFDRVYRALKDRIRSGMLRPGERLEPAVLADQLFSSVTPIRDALHRLTGERLVEAPRQEGFRVPQLTEATLRHLYSWHQDLLLLAIMKRREVALEPAAVEEESGSARETLKQIFVALARSTGNPEHVLALEAVGERLEPFERLEEMLLDAIETETAHIAHAIRRADRKALRRALVAYHRRRSRIVPELLARLQDGS